MGDVTSINVNEIWILRCGLMWIRCGLVWIRCGLMWIRCRLVRIRCKLVWLRCNCISVDEIVRKFYGWIQNDRWATQIEDCELTESRRVRKTVARSLLISSIYSKGLSSSRFRLERWDPNQKRSVSWTDI